LDTIEQSYEVLFMKYEIGLTVAHFLKHYKDHKLKMTVNDSK